MGEPMDRSHRIFMKLGTFEEAFPTLDDAVVEFTEFDFLMEKRTEVWRLAWQSGLAPCGNPFCRRGGYELDREVSRMVRAQEAVKDIEVYCHGDEGSPKGRKIGRRCQHKIEAKIVLKYKAETMNVASGKPREGDSLN
jgi:hypothetical protein